MKNETRTVRAQLLETVYQADRELRQAHQEARYALEHPESIRKHTICDLREALDNLNNAIALCEANGIKL